MDRIVIDNPHTQLDVQVASSLCKAFADGRGPAPEPPRLFTALRGERYSFQIVLRWHMQHRMDLVAETEAPEGIALQLRAVDSVPVRFPTYLHTDDNYLRTDPGLYPDVLRPLEDGRFRVAPRLVSSLWVDAQIAPDAAPGEHELVVRIATADGSATARVSLRLEVLDVVAQRPQLKHTEWFHADCLADYYGVESLSEAHWALIERFLARAASHGQTMILTPLFTPPLDTAVGGERTTVQLIEVHEDAEGQWRFGFDGLARWVEMARRVGFEYIELSHLFTQWGLEAAPKIMVHGPDGELKQRFGWETDARGEDYRGFLTAFLPELVAWLDANGLAGQAVFHLSDEPGEAHLDNYEAARDLVEPLIGDYPIMDALSSFAFYERGLVRHPVVASNHIGPFLEAGVEGLWTYYCCSQHQRVANRYMSMPSGRNRILGWQLFWYDIEGFLHWGYNFYNSQYSLERIDPYHITDADLGFPSGDAYLVYPGPEGEPYDSLRQLVLADALQDLAALQQLAARDGRDAVRALIREVLGHELTMVARPEDQQRLPELREAVNRRLAAQD